MGKPTPTIPNPAQLAAYRRLLQRLFGDRTPPPPALPTVKQQQAKGGRI